MLLTFALLLILPGGAEPTLDELIAKIQADQKAAESAAKSLAESKAAALAKFLATRDALVKLGVIDSGPDPKPPEPKPVDPLAAKLKTAYDAESAADKKADAMQLAALYRKAVKYANDPATVSSRQLLKLIRDAGAGVVDDDALVALRTVVAGELATALGGATDTALTDGQRKAAGDLFLKLATILEAFP